MLNILDQEDRIQDNQGGMDDPFHQQGEHKKETFLAT